MRATHDMHDHEMQQVCARKKGTRTSEDRQGGNEGGLGRGECQKFHKFARECERAIEGMFAGFLAQVGKR